MPNVYVHILLWWISLNTFWKLGNKSPNNKYEISKLIIYLSETFNREKIMLKCLFSIVKEEIVIFLLKKKTENILSHISTNVFDFIQKKKHNTTSAVMASDLPTYFFHWIFPIWTIFFNVWILTMTSPMSNFLRGYLALYQVKSSV